MGPSKVDGRAVEVVQIADVGGTLLRLSIDAETHDVLKHTFVGDTPQGLAASRRDFLGLPRSRRLPLVPPPQSRPQRRSGAGKHAAGMQVNAGYERSGLLEEKAHLSSGLQEPLLPGAARLLEL